MTMTPKWLSVSSWMHVGQHRVMGSPTPSRGSFSRAFGICYPIEWAQEETDTRLLPGVDQRPAASNWSRSSFSESAGHIFGQVSHGPRLITLATCRDLTAS